MLLTINANSLLDVVCFEAMKNQIEIDDLMIQIENKVISLRTPEQMADKRQSPTFESFDIKTIQDLANIPVNSWPALKHEMPALLHTVMGYIAFMLAANNTLDYLSIQDKIMVNNLVWTDDSKTEQSSEITAICENQVLNISRSRQNDAEEFAMDVKSQYKQ